MCAHVDAPQNERRWQPAKLLAERTAIDTDVYRGVMGELNATARRLGLKEYDTYSRVWEYPWLWQVLEPFRDQGLRIVDIGSELSAFPWFLAEQGFDVIVSDHSPRYVAAWQRAAETCRASVARRILDAQELDLETASVDVVLSVSVIEHVPNKRRALAEAVRVARPDGALVMTFDIVEPAMGMSFPAWNGLALTMHELDALLEAQPGLDADVAHLPWNTEVIPAYLEWHRGTAPHHNYVTGAAVVPRDATVGRESLGAWMGRGLRRWRSRVGSRLPGALPPGRRHAR